ncbi:hypothetical protein Zm00014a_020433 [Zea mays]|uniref:Uncharacterized protein n=1 Tax=Zea mays TaxID=4577 RepID=A0A3L6E8S5_MAIZE|nr:hypothetical protein Zm00014a_020433 [Zea mays]
MSNNQTALCRYKISLTAEDDTDTAEFIFFGRMAQRLIKKMWTPSSRLIHPVSFQEKLQIYWKSLSSGMLASLKAQLFIAVFPSK